MDSGVFSVARDIWDHPVLGSEPFTKREAWMWLVSAAAWKPMRVGHGGRVVALERGEFLFSLRFLADKWKWSKSRVERFILVLENRDMIRDTSRDKTQVYSISNYNTYQLGGDEQRDEKRDTNRDESGTAAGQQRDKEEPLNHSTIESEQGKREERAVRAAPAKGTRWPPDKVVPEDWLTDADIQRHEHDLPRIDLRLEATRFANYWASKSGGNATKTDWHRTWINWALDDTKRKIPSNGRGTAKSSGINWNGIAEFARSDSGTEGRTNGRASGAGQPAASESAPCQIAAPNETNANHEGGDGAALGTIGNHLQRAPIGRR